MPVICGCCCMVPPKAPVIWGCCIMPNPPVICGCMNGLPVICGITRPGAPNGIPVG